MPVNDTGCAGVVRGAEPGKEFVDQFKLPANGRDGGALPVARRHVREMDVEFRGAELVPQRLGHGAEQREPALIPGIGQQIAPVMRSVSQTGLGNIHADGQSTPRARPDQARLVTAIKCTPA